MNLGTGGTGGTSSGGAGGGGTSGMSTGGQSPGTGGSGGAGGNTSCPAGSETCACYGNGSCNAGLTCASNLCVNLGTGGTGGTGGAGGTGGTSGACQEGATQCLVNSVQTCSNGQWGAAVACGARQTCTGTPGAVQCTCKTDPVCSSVGSTCASAATLANCVQDDQGCFYQSSATTCANGACTGAAGAASCCTNACTAGATDCLSSTSLQTCAVAANGCTAYTTSTCTNGACSVTAGVASCCTNACSRGAYGIDATECLSDTSLKTCSVAANGCTVSTTSTCSTGLVCERRYPEACVDPNWAEWPMPNSQADVTAGAPNLEAYKDNGDGTVTDNVTELMWQQVVPTATYSQAGAANYCSTLTLAGHSDWRLPSVIELVSIVDLGPSTAPMINGTYFPSTPANVFWSSSPVAGSPSDAWGVDFYGGCTDRLRRVQYLQCSLCSLRTGHFYFLAFGY